MNILQALDGLMAALELRGAGEESNKIGAARRALAGARGTMPSVIVVTRPRDLPEKDREGWDLAMQAMIRAQREEARMAIPDWVGDLLARRSAVETKLRAPLLAQCRGRQVVLLTPEELWALADELSVPSVLRIRAATSEKNAVETKADQDRTDREEH